MLGPTAEVLDTIVTASRPASSPPAPAELSTFFRIGCHVCNPDGLGTAELRKQWERKRDDPALARVRRAGRADLEPEAVA